MFSEFLKNNIKLRTSDNGLGFDKSCGGEGGGGLMYKEPINHKPVGFEVKFIFWEKPTDSNKDNSVSYVSHTSRESWQIIA